MVVGGGIVQPNPLYNEFVCDFLSLGNKNPS